MVALAGRIVEELIDELRRRRDASDGEGWNSHAFESRAERLHVRDLARHQELQRVFGAGVPAKADQTLVDNLRPRFGCDVTAKIHVQFAGDLQIIRGPGVAHRVVQVDTASAGDRDQGVRFRFFAHRLHCSKENEQPAVCVGLIADNIRNDLAERGSTQTWKGPTKAEPRRSGALTADDRDYFWFCGLALPLCWAGLP